MKRMANTAFIIGAGLLGLGLIVVFLAGPRVDIDTTIHPIILPADLEEYLAKTEGAFTDLIPGNEKILVWDNESGAKTSLSVVYLHGFSASRQETAPLADLVASKLGANLFYTRFTGHGRGGEAMVDGSVNAWLNNTYEAVEIGRRIGEQVIIIGVSTGGTAATWLATQPFAENVAAIVLISPNFAPANPLAKLLLWPWGRHLAELYIGPERSWEPQNARQGAFWTHRYPTRALLPMMGLIKLAKSSNVARIAIPMLVIYSPADRVVNTGEIEAMYAKIGAENKLLLPYADTDDPRQHILAGDILSPGSTQALAMRIVDFLENLNGTDSIGDKRR